MKRPIVFTSVAYYLPGYKAGGPIRTIANLVDHLGGDYEFFILSSDRDVFDDLSYPNIEVNEWNRVGRASVFYASRDFMRVLKIAKLIRHTRHDVLYLNSFFSPRFTIIPLIARRLGLIPKRPLIIAPRGEFSKGALRLKTWKKTLYLRFARWLGLFRDASWQASSELEKLDICEYLHVSPATIRVAIDLPPYKSSAFVNQPGISNRSDQAIRIVYLSRITPMKNLKFALSVLSKVTADVCFDIYGVIDDKDYWKECQDVLSRMPPNVKAAYHGPVPHTMVHSIFENHDLLFLPTRGENYGHVIREALEAGTPVLTSDQTPWIALDQHAVGWTLSLAKEPEFVSVIDSMACENVKDMIDRRNRAINFANDLVRDKGATNDSRMLFVEVMGSAAR